MTRWTVMLATALVLCAPYAHAQHLVLGGQVSGGSGIEGGDPGNGRTGVSARAKQGIGRHRRLD